MHWSKYNILYNIEDDSYVLYNMLSGFFSQIDNVLYKKIIDVKNNKNINLLSQKEYDIFCKNKVLVNSDDEEFDKIKAAILRERNDSRRLNLTLAPTQDCNFKCKYCFESSRPAIYMKENVEEAIVQFVAKQKPDIVHVCWYGGEPLMAKDSIFRLTEKLQSLGKKYSASIVTNGYLMDESFILSLNKLKIKLVQITIDGNKTIHNERRPHISDSNSFDKIVNNIKNLVNLTKGDIFLSVRVNVDKTNQCDFVDVYRMIKNIEPTIQVYPGFVHDESSCKSSCYFNNKKEQATFYNNLYSQHHIYIPEMVPSFIMSSCMARCSNSFLIGPMGEIYKCWHHLGCSDKIIGNVLKENVLFNTVELNRYLKEDDYIDNIQCKKCKFFPICGGGCADFRINKKESDCTVFKYNMLSFLRMKYNFYQLNLLNK